METKTFFKKLEYGFLVESTKIGNVSFPYKTAMSEAYYKERSFASNYFIFLKVFVSVEEPLVKSFFYVSATQIFIFIPFVSAEILFEDDFFL